jgi:hypothetical protein
MESVGTLDKYLNYAFIDWPGFFKDFDNQLIRVPIDKNQII